MQRNYLKLSVEDFGRYLFHSNDLDPVYVILHKLYSNGNMDIDQLQRWVLGYILCYHCGAACYFSEKKGVHFFEELLIAARNAQEAPVGGRWPRSHERRHWRGQFALNVVGRLQERYGEHPENFLLNVAGLERWSAKPELTPFKRIQANLKMHYGFGPWATFKLADIIDRVGLAPVEFKYQDVVIYDDPVKAAERLVKERYDLPDAASVKPEAVKDVFDWLIDHFSDQSAPPLHDRPVDIQEIETVLCKWKSHQNGRYPLYNDLREIKEGIAPWAKISRTAALFQANIPQIPQEVV